MYSSVDRVKVFASILSGRTFTVEQKLAVVQEASQPERTIAHVLHRRGIAPSLTPSLQTPYD
jgi:transposase-like protein